MVRLDAEVQRVDLPGGDGLNRRPAHQGGNRSDGPYIEAKEIVVSFGLIQADNYDAAVAIARECPTRLYDEIRELAGYA